ncbi:MAG: transglutaminase-like domain-containing protein, partial [Candidatus Acidiferrales bacterium]
WQDIGMWYSGLLEGRRLASPEIKAKVAALTAGKATTLEKMEALAAYSQHQIRYAAIEVGIGGFQPHAAGDVLSHGYGDCKDKATLLNTMLGEIGVESYNVMIDTERGYVRPNFPAIHFDHSIVAIRLPDDVPGSDMYAVVKDAKLGRLLFFDPTDEFVPLGYIPSIEQGSYALVVARGGGELVQVPVLPPATNRLMRTAKLTLSATGDLSGEFQEYRWGGPAQDEREAFLETDPAKRATIFEDFLGIFLDNFTLTQASIGNLDQYDQNFTLSYQVKVSGYAKTAGDLLILRPRVVGEKRDGPGLFTGKERKYPVEFEEETRQDDDFEIALPAGYVVDELPDPVKVECPYGSYQSDVKVSGNTLVYKRTYQINDIQVPTEKLAEARQFFQQIAADENSSAILRRATP